MKRAIGSGTGTGTFLVQRATAAGLALSVPVLAARILMASPTDFAGWQDLFAPLWVRVLTLLAVAALALHAWVGMRDIFMDYVHPTLVRLALYLVVIVVLAGSVAWVGGALWSAG